MTQLQIQTKENILLILKHYADNSSDIVDLNI